MGCKIKASFSGGMGGGGMRLRVPPRLLPLQVADALKMPLQTLNDKSEMRVKLVIYACVHHMVSRPRGSFFKKVSHVRSPPRAAVLVLFSSWKRTTQSPRPGMFPLGWSAWLPLLANISLHAVVCWRTNHFCFLCRGLPVRLPFLQQLFRSRHNP